MVKIQVNQKEKIKTSLILGFFFTSSYILSFLNWPNLPEYKITFFLNIIFTTIVYAIILYFFLFFSLKKNTFLIRHCLGIIILYQAVKILILSYGLQGIKLLFDIYDINFNHNTMFLYILSIILLYILAYKFFFKNFINYLRFIKIFTFVVFILSIFLIFNTQKLLNKNNSLNLINFLSNTQKNNFNKIFDRRVNVIIFDEADYDFIISNRKKLKLKNFNKIIEQSLSFHNAYPPGKDTAQSIPNFLMGEDGTGTFSYDRKLIYFKKKNKKEFFKYENTFFNFSEKKDFVAIVAGADRKIIYCNYLKIKLCRDISNDIPFKYINLDGFEFLYSAFNHLFKSYLFDTERLKTDYKLIQSLDMVNLKDHNVNINKNLDLLATKVLQNNNIEIAYIHYPYPHYPAHYAKEILGNNVDKDWYSINIMLMDKTIGNILKLINEKENKTMTIITSDHGLRYLKKEIKEIRRVPYIINLNYETKKEEVIEDFSTFHTKKIIQKFLNHKANNYSDIVNIIKNLPVVRHNRHSVD